MEATTILTRGAEDHGQQQAIAFLGFVAGHGQQPKWVCCSNAAGYRAEYGGIPDERSFFTAST